PLTAAGPSRISTGFPYRSPIGAEPIMASDAPIQALGAGHRLGCGDLRTLIGALPLLRPRHLGRDIAQGRARHRVRDPRGTALARAQPAAPGTPDQDCLRGNRRAAPALRPRETPVAVRRCIRRVRPYPRAADRPLRTIPACPSEKA